MCACGVKMMTMRKRQDENSWISHCLLVFHVNVKWTRVLLVKRKHSKHCFFFLIQSIFVLYCSLSVLSLCSVLFHIFFFFFLIILLISVVRPFIRFLSLSPAFLWFSPAIPSFWCDNKQQKNPFHSPIFFSVCFFAWNYDLFFITFSFGRTICRVGSTSIYKKLRAMRTSHLSLSIFGAVLHCDLVGYDTDFASSFHVHVKYCVVVFNLRFEDIESA